MKPIIPFALISAFAAVSAHGAVTKPVGYTTETLAPGFNFIGLTLHEPILVSGSLEAVSGTDLEVAAGSLDSLDTSVPHLIEITSGSISGAVLEVASVDVGANTVSVAALPEESGLAAGDSFAIREAATIGSVFGTGDDVLLQKGSPSTGGLIFLPDGAGGFAAYYHSEDSVLGDGSWTEVGGSADQESTPIVYTDGFFVQVRGGEVDLVVSGEVKTTSTSVAVLDGFMYYSGVFPVGSTLDSSGLADSAGFRKGGPSSGDLVFLPAGSGSFRTFHHSEDSVLGDGAWTEVGGSGDGSTPVPSGFILQVRADSPYQGSINAPDSYSSL